MAEETLLNNPYETITEYAEELYPYTGGKIFKYLSLQPCSLVLPQIPYFNQTKRSTIHVLVLGKAGMAKSSITSLYSNIALTPIDFKKKTSAELREHLFKHCENKKVTLISDDASQILQDPKFVKMIEGIAEEQRVSDDTLKHGTRTFKVYGAFTLMGVYDDISPSLRSGGLSRMNPIVFNHSREEQDKVGEYIRDNIMEENETSMEEFEKIKKHYSTIYEIQEGLNKDFPKITGVIIEKSEKNKIHKLWRDLVIERIIKTEKETESWFRDLEDGFRFASSSALLNLKKRKLETNEKGTKIIIEPEDTRLACRLMGEEIVTKYHIIDKEGWREKLVNFGKISQALKGAVTGQEVINELTNFKKENKDLFTTEADSPPQPHSLQRKGRPSQK